MEHRMPGFAVTGGKGFHMTFKNNWTVSVQFGPRNYCENQDYTRVKDYEKLMREVGAMGSHDAECAVWYKGGELVPLYDDTEAVRGYMNTAEVLDLMNAVSNLPDKSCSSVYDYNQKLRPGVRALFTYKWEGKRLNAWNTHSGQMVTVMDKYTGMMDMWRVTADDGWSGAVFPEEIKVEGV